MTHVHSWYHLASIHQATHTQSMHACMTVWLTVCMCNMADIECPYGGLLTQVEAGAMERLWGPLTWLYYRGWPANTGPNTCYGDFGAH